MEQQTNFVQLVCYCVLMSNKKLPVSLNINGKIDIYLQIVLLMDLHTDLKISNKELKNKFLHMTSPRYFHRLRRFGSFGLKCDMDRHTFIAIDKYGRNLHFFMRERCEGGLKFKPLGHIPSPTPDIDVLIYEWWPYIIFEILLILNMDFIDSFTTMQEEINKRRTEFERIFLINNI